MNLVRFYPKGKRRLDIKIERIRFSNGKTTEGFLNQQLFFNCQGGFNSISCNPEYSELDLGEGVILRQLIIKSNKYEGIQNSMTFYLSTLYSYIQNKQ